MFAPLSAPPSDPSEHAAKPIFVHLASWRSSGVPWRILSLSVSLLFRSPTALQLARSLASEVGSLMREVRLVRVTERGRQLSEPEM